MSNDIIGPADSANAVTTRPPEGRTFGALDSWFKDCSSPDIDDGTEIRADFLNNVVSVLRTLWRANGFRNDGATPIVTESGADDYGITKSVQQMVQRNTVGFAADTGGANHLVVTLSPALIEYKGGIVVRTIVANTVTGAADLNVNGLGAKAIIHPDGAPCSARDLVAGMCVEFMYDGTSWQMMGAPINVLTANLDYYVNGATGSDGNSGLTSGTAFATLQKAQNSIQLFNLNGYTVTVHVADFAGYGPVTCNRINGSGSVIYLGNTVTPANVTVTGTVGPAFIFSGSDGYTIDGFKVVSVGNSPGLQGAGIACVGRGFANLKTIEFGAALDCHMWVDGGGGAFLIGPFRINGSATTHILSVTGSVVRSAIPEPAITIVSAVTFSQGFITCRTNATCTVHYSAINNPGNVTGPRYVATANGVIDSGNSGASYYPGTVAGSTATGGQYV